MQAQISVQVGTEIEGIIIDAIGIELLWPGMTDQQVSNQLREVVAGAIEEAVVSNFSSKSALDKFLLDHVTESH